MENQVEKYIVNIMEISYMYQQVEPLIQALTNANQIRDAILASASNMKTTLDKCNELTPEQTQQYFTFVGLYNKLNEGVKENE